MWPFKPHSRNREQVRELQLLLATQIAHVATIASLKVVEEKDEIILRDLKPSLPGKEFLEMVVFFAFCIGMLGRYRAVPARNYILDSAFLFLGGIILEVSDIETMREFEKNRCSQLTRYMAQTNRAYQGRQSVNGGFITDSLIATLEQEVLKRRFPRLRSVLEEFIVAQEMLAEHELAEYEAALQVNLGRNDSPTSIEAIREKVATLKALSRNSDRLTHIEEAKDILRVYLQKAP
jgi:hypothetical protein